MECSGRRLICLFAGVFYILNCILLVSCVHNKNDCVRNDFFIQNFSSLWIMVISSLCWGVGNAFYEVGFEAWLIQEYRDVSD